MEWVARDGINHLQLSSIDTEENLELPNEFIASFKPLASASLDCGRPLNQVVFALMNSPQSPLRRMPTPYHCRSQGWKPGHTTYSP
ncbi:hypothetical protein MTR_2g034100 [Medicago truncatula]|uniref:Uncharacterized protein n=1 Tax=Medicago truncatula TaxID=3880 RepID=A2Q2W4_MEDTR|nr:hypothetical protein MtrDRAFT_AC152185g16v2 [Medicago truncatula]AES64990.1 hypothetical protein MTR_2g034100 [Medicago truncatula]